MSQPQKLCTQCRQVAGTGSRFCKFHARQRANARNKRATAIRMERFRSEYRNLENVIKTPSLTDALAIAVCADSIIRALRRRKVDYPRACLFLYTLQTACAARKHAEPHDPDLPLARRVLYHLQLELAAAKAMRRTLQGGATESR